MSPTGVGILLIVAATLVVGAILITSRGRLRSLPVTAALAAAGVAVATGGLLVQDSVSVWDRVLATGVLALVVPMHVRVAFGQRANGE